MSAVQKVVLVTGCSKGGIGFALCDEFAARGCIVYATSQRPKTIEGFQNSDIRKMILDVTNRDDIERTVETVVAKSGKIDILVNDTNATTIAPVAEVNIDRVRNTFELNTFAALNMSNAVIPFMFKRKQGMVVNIGSHASVETTTLYTTKAALQTISEGLAVECKPFGVKVMLIIPGGTMSNTSRNRATASTLLLATLNKEYEVKVEIVDRIEGMWRAPDKKGALLRIAEPVAEAVGSATDLKIVDLSLPVVKMRSSPPVRGSVRTLAAMPTSRKRPRKEDEDNDDEEEEKEKEEARPPPHAMPCNKCARDGKTCIGWPNRACLACHAAKCGCEKSSGRSGRRGDDKGKAPAEPAVKSRKKQLVPETIEISDSDEASSNEEKGKHKVCAPDKSALSKQVRTKLRAQLTLVEGRVLSAQSRVKMAEAELEKAMEDLRGLGASLE